MSLNDKILNGFFDSKLCSLAKGVNAIIELDVLIGKANYIVLNMPDRHCNIQNSIFRL